MSVLRSLEEKIAGLVEGTFGRVFRSEVRPVELARKLAKEMDEHRTVSVSRTYVPNEYVVWLSTQDRERYEGVEQSVIDELGAYLLEHARRERLALVSRPQIEFRTDDRLSLGEFGIQARLIEPHEPSAGPAAASAPAQPEARPADMGHTMVYSTSARHQAALEDVGSGTGAARRRAIVVVDGKRLLVPPGGAVIGRSRECDIVVDDSNVSRRHAEISPGGQGWRIQDLGSTNGVRVNGRQVDGPHPLESGDRLELGTVSVTFEVE
ncbi:hypothetical protein DSM104299_00012 [Baekduia alba]|uniref:FhaA domain-containing protein n=1 Tax=Baekduia alba TaxID=2997333 RepID=UPI0023419357|nr:DUF3662 and FHA domain-containing protein [Baekduia alba]WCB91341.1 hypothetical protein DSM104299_00012 [Baekduia alba]